MRAGQSATGGDGDGGARGSRRGEDLEAHGRPGRDAGRRDATNFVVAALMVGDGAGFALSALRLRRFKPYMKVGAEGKEGKALRREKDLPGGGPLGKGRPYGREDEGSP